MLLERSKQTALVKVNCKTVLPLSEVQPAAQRKLLRLALLGLGRRLGLQALIQKRAIPSLPDRT